MRKFFVKIICSCIAIIIYIFLFVLIYNVLRGGPYTHINDTVNMLITLISVISSYYLTRYVYKYVSCFLRLKE